MHRTHSPGGLRAAAACLAVLVLGSPIRAEEPLGPGDHRRTVQVDDRVRSYVVHVPESYDPTAPTPVVLAFHGAAMNAGLMAWFTGLDRTAAEAGFLVVYPNGVGLGTLRVWNAGGWVARDGDDEPAGGVDEVAFVRTLLDDLPRVVNVDPRRVYAVGMSNGAMLCHLLAAKLSDRIAAIGPVAGPLTFADPRPSRAVPILYLHGTDDRIVPFAGPDRRTPGGFSFLSAPDTVTTWVRVNRCREEPVEDAFANGEEPDRTQVVRRTYLPLDEHGAEVVFVEIRGGGHTWPGETPPVGFIGRSTGDLRANDLLWEFFSRHALP